MRMFFLALVKDALLSEFHCLHALLRSWSAPVVRGIIM